MALSYDEYPALQGPFEPARFASEVFDCEVVGEIPAGLSGAFYRVGAEWFYPPSHADDSPFAADGIASVFRIENGCCDFRARYIETPRYLANRGAREQLFGYYRNPFTDDERVEGVSGTVANTNIIMHAGKLLALKEDALPFELDPITLETIGPWDFGGEYKSPTFTAHPKIDGATGEMITYGYEAEGLASNAIWIYTIDPAGHVTSERKIRAPYLSMVHDIAISQNYIIIPIYGMIGSMERLREGKIHWGWDSSLPSYLGVMRRDGDGSDIRWFEGPEMAMVHTFSATDKDGVISLHAAVSDSNPFPFFPAVDGGGFDRAKARTTTRHYLMDTKSSNPSWQEQELFPAHSGALSRIDDRFQGQKYRYGFLGFSDNSKPFEADLGGRKPTNSYGRFDFETGEVEAMWAGPTHGLQEVTFAPRSAEADEGDGWLMGMATDYSTMRSELVIGDTRDLAAGPIARVKLPFKGPGQIHGNWVPNWGLPT